MTTSISRSVDDKHPVVLISGATGQIGIVLARDFAGCGWDVCLHSDGSQPGNPDFFEDDKLFDNRAIDGSRSKSFVTELASGEDAHNLIDRCSREFGHPRCLINQLLMVDTERSDIGTSAYLGDFSGYYRKSFYLLSQAFASSFPEDEKGIIINIIGSHYGQNRPHISSNKTFNSELCVLTEKMASSFAPSIRVNSIGNGTVLQGLDASDEKGATPEDIATTVRFILEAPAMTGQIIMLDGVW